MESGLRTVRFHSARASVNATFLAGVDYAVPQEFARQVVERERVADYADVSETPAGHSADIQQPSKKRSVKR